MGCGESGLSDPVTVLHDDIVAPPPPENVTAGVAGTTVTVSWEQPNVGDVAGYKVLVGEQSGGPYSQAHQGLLSRVSSSFSFQAASGTHYIVMKAVDWAGNESGYSPEQVVVVP